VTRKLFLGIVGFVIPSLAQRSMTPVLYATKEEKAFVDAFNLWAATGNRNGMTVDIKEIKAWHETTTAWKRLKYIVEQSYK